MQIKYFETAWNDIKNSPGWFGKLCLLALVGLIPIFGQIVMLGYLYGWARQIAWGAHMPMPASIFENEDGKFWRRGLFLLVISFVFGLIPLIITQVGTNMQSATLTATLYSLNENPSAVASGAAGVANGASMMLGSGLYLLGMILSMVVSVFAWVASMRASIYDNLSAGFQLGKIWKMMKQDMSGILKIFGMNLLVGLIFGLIFSVVIIALVFAIVLIGAGGVAGLEGGGAPSASVAVPLGIASVLLILVVTFFIMVGSMFIEALVARAMGYWTMQFDVPHWRGQDDPMPFEMMPPAPGAPPMM